MKGTLNFYNKNAKEFCEETCSIDMSHCQNEFLKYFTQKALILDAGCGSGRDSKSFINKGHKVEAFDASKEICEIATDYIGQRVICMRFEEIDYENKFDGIWASASLLHVSKDELPNVMTKMYIALKPQGIIYASFKYEETENYRGDRRYSDFTETTVKELFTNSGFEILEIFITSDGRKEKCDEKWVNVIAKRQ